MCVCVRADVRDEHSINKRSFFLRSKKIFSVFFSINVNCIICNWFVANIFFFFDQAEIFVLRLSKMAAN